MQTKVIEIQVAVMDYDEEDGTYENDPDFEAERITMSYETTDDGLEGELDADKAYTPKTAVYEEAAEIARTIERLVTYG